MLKVRLGLLANHYGKVVVKPVLGLWKSSGLIGRAQSPLARIGYKYPALYARQTQLYSQFSHYYFRLISSVNSLFIPTFHTTYKNNNKIYNLITL